MLTVLATLFSTVLTVQATMFLAFSQVNGLSHPIVYGATVQATIIFSSVMGVNCFSHPIFYGANCSSHHVIRSWVLTVLATLFSMVLTVLVTMSFVYGC